MGFLLIHSPLVGPSTWPWVGGDVHEQLLGLAVSGTLPHTYRPGSGPSTLPDALVLGPLGDR